MKDKEKARSIATHAYSHFCSLRSQCVILLLNYCYMCILVQSFTLFVGKIALMAKLDADLKIKFLVSWHKLSRAFSRRKEPILI